MNMRAHVLTCCVFLFNDTATTAIYTLSLHDALPIYAAALPARAAGGGDQLGADRRRRLRRRRTGCGARPRSAQPGGGVDRKSTRLNSSHPSISYAVFCLKKKIPRLRAVVITD